MQISQQIQNLYNIHTDNVKKIENDNLNNIYSESGLKYWKNKDVARYASVNYFNKYVKKYSLKSEKFLGFADAKNDIELSLLPHNIIISDDHNEGGRDLEVLDDYNLDKDFDFCFLNQTLEHLAYPERAIKNIYNHLNENGYLYMNWPVLNIPHMQPLYFYTGITVVCIMRLAEDIGFKIIESGSWGNKQYIDFIYENFNWPDYSQISLNNEGANRPCIGWVLLQK